MANDKGATALELVRMVRSLPASIGSVKFDAASRSVLFVLVSRGAGGQGQCFPSLQRLSLESGASIRTVMRRLSDLEELKVITRRRRVDTSTVYRINPRVLRKLSTDLSTLSPQARSQ